MRAIAAVATLALAACGGTKAGTTTGATTSSGGATTSTGASAGSTTSGAGTTSGAATTSGTATATSTSSGGTSGGLTVDNFDQAFSTTYCEVLYSCLGAAPYFAAQLCPAFPLDEFADLPGAVDAGRSAFHAAQAETCLGSLLDGGCNLTQVFQASCATVITGLEPEDAGCLSPLDCLSGSCATANCMTGFCTPFVESGGACDCPTCGACDPANNLTCVGTTCAPFAAVGVACGAVGDSNCSPGQACVGGLCATLPVAAGNPCTPGQGQCAAGSYCFATVGSLVGSCATQVALGQPCGEDVAHLLNIAGSDLECAGGQTAAACAGAGTLNDGGFASGLCGATSDVGGACTAPGAAIDTMDTYVDGCLAGLNCASGICAIPPSSGPCSTLSFPCNPASSYCDTASDTCKPQVAPGGACNAANTGECGLGGTCSINSICQGPTQACGSDF